MCWRVALALLAAVTALLSHPPLLVTILLLLLWPLLAFWQFSAGQTSDPIRTIQHTPQGWRLLLRNGQTHFAELVGPVRLNRLCIVLCWRELTDLADDESASRRKPVRDLLKRPAAQSWRIVIWADQVSTDDWRRFSVALRWRRREGSSGDKILSDSVALSSG